MRPYSLDLRERVVRALQSGIAQKLVAAQFDISLSSVQRFAYQYRTQGNLQSKVFPGRKRCISGEQEALLIQELNALQSPTVSNLAKRWQEITGKYIAASTIHYALQRLGYRYKKNENCNRA